MSRPPQPVARLIPLTDFANPSHSVLVDGASPQGAGGGLLILLAWLLGGWSMAIRTFHWE